MINLLTCLAVLSAYDSKELVQDSGKAARLIEKMDVSAQFRVRYEYRDVASYSTAAGLSENDDLFLFRSRLGFNLPVEDKINFFIQFQDSRTAGQESSVASNDSNVDVLQAYLEFKDVNDIPISVKVGRQKFAYGNQRVLSDLDWSNVTRAWDGAKVSYNLSDWWNVDGFYTVIKEGTGAEDDQDFYGLYSSCKAAAFLSVDAYLLQRRFSDNTFTSETGAGGDKIDLTYGLLLGGARDELDYSAEAAVQTGELVDDDISSFALAVAGGYRFDFEGKPRVGFEYTYASGDSSPTDGDIETFDPPFTFAHSYQGFADIFAWKNGHDYALKVYAALFEKLSCFVDLHLFRLAQREDSWYDAAGAKIRRDTLGNSSDDVGKEVDIHFKYPLSEKIGLWFGWSHFFAGDFVEDTAGTGKNMDWFFFQLVMNIG